MNGLAYDQSAMQQRLEAENASMLDVAVKGLPPGLRASFGGIGALGLDLLKGDLPLPVAVLKRSAREANRSWMLQFLHRSGVHIAPRGKTPMAPELVRMQMEDGAWSITATTAQQAAIFADFGVRRMILANQLVGKRNIAIVLDLLARHPDLELYCLADSRAGVALLAEATAARGLGQRPLQILMEVGAAGARTGVRDHSEALAPGTGHRLPRAAPEPARC
jgi:D-serine dehydratase